MEVQSHFLGLNFMRKTKKKIDIKETHCWSDQKSYSLTLVSLSFTLVLYIQNYPDKMEKLKYIYLDIDKNHLTVSVLLSQVLKALCYHLDLCTKSYKLPNYQLVST